MKLKYTIKEKAELNRVFNGLASVWDWHKPMELVAKVADDSRTLQQNALLWKKLGQLEARAKWHGQTLSADDWKDLLTAGLKKEQRMVRGIEGGFVFFGSRTSKMNTKQLSELLDFIDYFANSGSEGLEFSGFVDERYL